MNLVLTPELLERIHEHGEDQYPEEGAGFILGRVDGDHRLPVDVLPVGNTFAEEERSRRYMIAPQAMMNAEREAEGRGLDLIGVFHSHPDHPARPSEYDRRMALPWFIYVITSVQAGEAAHSRAWRLLDDREEFEEITLQVERNQEVS